MGRMNVQDLQPEQGDWSVAYSAKYHRTIFDYITIAFGYLFMPVGLVLAVLSLLSSHYKNYRKASNFNLLFHVFIGGFVEISIIFIVQWTQDTNTLGTTIIILIMFGLMLLLPALLFGRWAAKERFKFAQLTNQYILLILTNGLRYIGSISELTGQSESDVRRDILYLKSGGIIEPQIIFNEGFQQEAEANRTYGAQTTGSPDIASVLRHPNQTSQLPKSIPCTGCGAQNSVKPGQSKSCDYCGTTIAYS